MKGSLKGKNLLQLIFLIDMTESFKNIKELFKLYSVLPITSVECERVFSQVGRVKTKIRNSLSIDTLDQLIMVSRNGVGREKFNFEKAFIYWQKAKLRYFV